MCYEGARSQGKQPAGAGKQVPRQLPGETETQPQLARTE